MHAIPSIDITRFRTNDRAGAQQVIAEVLEACERIGFFTVTGHGVPKELIDRVYKNALAFFDLPEEEKLKIKKPDGPNYKGYSPMRSRTIGRSRDATLKPSLNESFAMGFVDVDEKDPYFRAPGAGSHFEPNVFPQKPDGFKEGMIAYYHAMEDLSKTIMTIFARGLGIDEAYFLDKMDRQISVLRLVNYPALTQEATAGEERAAAHSDTGAVTILLTDDPPGRAGLQVRTPGGDWIDVFRAPDAFVVNIGDTLSRWTNDRFVSTMHRVVNPPVINGKSAPRLSIPFFCQPNYDAVIECVETCAGPGNPPRYQPITSGDILSNRYISSYSLDKKKPAMATAAP
jgi:isopenicillin N synthase-like dioxygenase